VLYDNGNRGEKDQAHHVSEIETRMKNVDAKLDLTSNSIEKLHENQEELASAYHVDERTETISHVPSVITTVNKTPINAKMVSKMVSDGMALLIKELRSEIAPGTTRSKAAPDQERSS